MEGDEYEDADNEDDGGDAFGRWGDGARGETGPDPQILGLMSNTKTFVQISAGRSVTCAIDKDGEIWCWGDNEFGQLGRGTMDPEPVAHPNPEMIVLTD